MMVGQGSVCFEWRQLAQRTDYAQYQRQANRTRAVVSLLPSKNNASQGPSSTGVFPKACASNLKDLNLSSNL